MYLINQLAHNKACADLWLYYLNASLVQRLNTLMTSALYFTFRHQCYNPNSVGVRPVFHICSRFEQVHLICLILHPDTEFQENQVISFSAILLINLKGTLVLHVVTPPYLCSKRYAFLKTEVTPQPPKQS